MPLSRFDPSASAPMARIVRVAIVVVTVAFFSLSTLHAIQGHRDLAIVMALATPLGISAMGFARAGHIEAAVALLCLVLVTVVTLNLVMGRLGVHDMAVTAYSGVVLVAALLLTRRAFVAVAVITLLAASLAFFLDSHGHTASLVARQSGAGQYVEFLVITMAFAILGRVAAEELAGSLGSAHHAAQGDPLTGLANRAGFLGSGQAQLDLARAQGKGAVLVLLDLDGFRRVNVLIGHPAADHLLKEVARRLALASEGHFAARVGDDEFAVLATGVDEGDAATLARALHATLDFAFLGVEVRNAAGHACFPRDGDSIESLHLRAEGALAAAKARTAPRVAGPGDAS
jgi:diguanylate cyclase (GGDEF)-like protein